MSARPFAPTARPYAYIRKTTKGTGESKPDQIAGARRLAERLGYDPASLVILDGDWNISASREQRERRLAGDFGRLLADTEAGLVSAILATDEDRLARDRTVAHQLSNVAEDRSVLIHTPHATFDLATEGARWHWDMTAAKNEEEVRKMSRKAQERVVSQRERGVQLGNKPYGSKPGEDPQQVVEAFRIAGSYHGAARLLIERGIASQRGHLPSQNGGGMQGWSATTVRSVIRRNAPDLIPPSPKQGARTRSTHIFQRLLICPHDGAILTTMPRKDASVAYICRIGHRSPAGAHPRPWAIAETGVLAWAKRVTAGVFKWDASLSVADASDIGTLENRKRLAGKALMAGAMGEEEFERIVEAVDIELRDLNLNARAASTWHLGIDWTLPPADLNVRLRELWKGVVMAYEPTAGPRNHQHTRDMDLVPVRPLWRIEPEEFDQEEQDWLDNNVPSSKGEHA